MARLWAKAIPPFLILHVADQPGVSAQAERLELRFPDPSLGLLGLLGLTPMLKEIILVGVIPIQRQ
jgi:hypothetical protein